MERPLVSVVLCTYNGAAFLPAQIESILSQSYAPLELIISDDASTDATPSILRQYEKHPAIRVFYQEKNIGLTANFSFAARQARGELIAFSDQDDIWMKNKIGILVEAIGTSPLVYSDSLLVDDSGESLHKKLSDLKKMYTGDDSRGFVLYDCVWGHGMLITKQLLRRSMPMPAGVHHDVWITFQALLNGGITYHDEVLTYYRQHGSSHSQTLPEKKSRRIKDTRHAGYKMKLQWIALMKERERPAYQPFYEKLLKLYAAKEHRRYVFPLVSFMLKHREELFRLSNKGFASQFVEILKQARGERP
jgi:glycosyltransferase involved in cell wall biosynthesis